MIDLYDVEDLGKGFFDRPYTCILDSGYEDVCVHKTVQGKFFFYNKEGDDLDAFTINHQKSIYRPAIEYFLNNLDRFTEAGYYRFQFRHPELDYFSGLYPSGIYFMYYEEFDGTISTEFDKELQLELSSEILLNAKALMEATPLPTNKRLLIVFDGTREVYKVDNPIFGNYYKLRDSIPDFGEPILERIRKDFDKMLDDEWQELLNEGTVNGYASILATYYFADVVANTGLESVIYNHKLLDYTLLARAQYPNLYDYFLKKDDSLVLSFSELFGTDALLSIYAFIFLRVIDELYVRVDPKRKRILTNDTTK